MDSSSDPDQVYNYIIGSEKLPSTSLINISDESSLHLYLTSSGYNKRFFLLWTESR